MSQGSIVTLLVGGPERVYGLTVHASRQEAIEALRKSKNTKSRKDPE